MFYLRIIIHYSLIFKQVAANPKSHPDYGPLPPEPEPRRHGDDPPKDDGKIKGHWDKRLTSFQKLIFIKAFQEEKVFRNKEKF